jgi:enterochelin esterase-like enzyme
MKAPALLTLVIALSFGAMAMPVAQEAVGRPAAPAGTVEHVTVHGKSLEGNLEGDSPDRPVTVYLPPGYARDEARRYPVVYLLHGYGVRDDTFTNRLATLQESADRLAAAPGFSVAIVVTPNAFTLHKGSMYSSSVTTGDWERFVAEDLVAYIDGHYRTIANRMSRGLGGHSMGGYGAIRIGMKRPDVFSSLYIMSGCCLAANRNPRPETMAAVEAIKSREQAAEAERGPSVALASAAAWSPNPKNPPFFVDLPMKDGRVRPEIVAKWVANAPLEMIDQYAANLKKYYAIAIEVGTSDTLLASNKRLDEAMTRLKVPHGYEEYDGDHTNRVRERIERNVLPFFSKNLAAPANPTSPSPQDR